ncbi:MAG: hypothetical protein V8T90_01385 [Victivallales bacterium]
MNNPGWVDLQVNGHNGVYFSDPALSADGFLRAADGVLESGTAVFLPTIITCAPEVCRRNLQLIRKAVTARGLSRQIPGIHLEGPFLSDKPGAIGVHNPAWVRSPSAEAVRELFQAAEGFIRLITIAAEVPGAEEAIREAKRLGILVSVGHHLATGKDLHRATGAGAQMLTHLGNGIPNLLDRHRNPVWAGLAEDSLTAMLIADGHHLPADVIKVMIRCKSPEKIIIVSDASPATGFAPGHYTVMGNDAILEPNGKLYNPHLQCLVGSASTLSRCMEHLASLELLSDNELHMVGRDNALRMLESLS